MIPRQTGGHSWAAIVVEEAVSGLTRAPFRFETVVPSIYSSAHTELAKLLIYGLFRKIRVLAQDGEGPLTENQPISNLRAETRLGLKDRRVELPESPSALSGNARERFISSTRWLAMNRRNPSSTM